MKISDLVPNLYKNNLEMYNIIMSEEKELETNLKKNIDNSFLDTFASQATENGISKFEQLFNIKPNPYTETLQFRRERIMNRLVSALPYTEKFLINKLNSMLGEGNWNYEINYNTYTLKIYSLRPGKGWYNELLNFLKQVVPCNIEWSVTVYAATWGIIKDSFTSWNAIKEMTWQELMDAEWSN